MKTYEVVYKTGQRQTVKGERLVFFSGISTVIQSSKVQTVYLNADEVRSVTEAPI